VVAEVQVLSALDVDIHKEHELAMKASIDVSAEAVLRILHLSKTYQVHLLYTYLER